MRPALFQGVDRRLADVPGRGEVRLADAQRDHVVHLRHDLEEIADARLGQVDDVTRDKTVGVHDE